jgi:maleylacetate reductase
LLPHVIAFNAAAAPEATRIIASSLDTDDPAAALFALAARVGAPTRLADLGFFEPDVAVAVQRITTAEFPNPRSPDPAAVTELITAARLGTPPVAGRLA